MVVVPECLSQKRRTALLDRGGGEKQSEVTSSTLRPFSVITTYLLNSALYAFVMSSQYPKPNQTNEPRSKKDQRVIPHDAPAPAHHNIPPSPIYLPIFPIPNTHQVVSTETLLPLSHSLKPRMDSSMRGVECARVSQLVADIRREVYNTIYLMIVANPTQPSPIQLQPDNRTRTGLSAAAQGTGIETGEAAPVPFSLLVFHV